MAIILQKPYVMSWYNWSFLAIFSIQWLYEVFILWQVKEAFLKKHKDQYELEKLRATQNVIMNELAKVNHILHYQFKWNWVFYVLFIDGLCFSTPCSR